jgi:hypothetical protein
MASWWVPEDVAFVDALPMTATGKIHKVTLRERFKDHDRLRRIRWTSSCRVRTIPAPADPSLVRGHPAPSAASFAQAGFSRAALAQAVGLSAPKPSCS